MQNEESVNNLVSIPYTELGEKTLTRMIESFVLREGTDYGDHEFSLEQKVTQVLLQLKRGEVVVVFDPKEESFDIRKAIKP